MRLTAVPAFIVSCLVLAGCASNSGPEAALDVAPSKETTSAIARPPAPIPSASIGSGATAVTTQQKQTAEALAWADPVQQPDPFKPVAPAGAVAAPAQRPVQMASAAAAMAPSPSVRQQIYRHRFRDAKPINFGRITPAHFPVHGVDVSRWQGEIDWPKLRTQGANFAYIKATDGGDHLDPMFKTNWRRAKDAGIRRGAYHFFYWCRTAGEQADWFIRNVPRDPEALPPVIDVEYNAESSCKRRLSPETVREKMQVFMDKLERHYGKRPVIYTAPDFYADNLRGAFQNYPFWLRSVAAHPSVRYPGRKWLFWQYSGSGLSHGVDEKIDLNVFYGSERDWHRWISGHSS